MRPSLLPGLITAAQRNRDRGFADGALFELGQAYRGAEPEDQFVAASGVRFGRSALIGLGPPLVRRSRLTLTCFAAKADAIAALAALGIDQASLTVTREAPSWFHPGRSGALKLGPKTRARRVRRVPSRSARQARHRSADRRLRALSRRCSAVEAQRREQGARGLGPSAGQARLCLPARRRDRRGRGAARRARRRPRADQPRSACSTCSPAKACPRARSRSPSR